MRKIKFLLVGLTVFAATNTFAQVNKGQWLIGGDAGFSSSKTGSGPSLTSISLSPNVGYFFINNFAGGGRISFASVSQNSQTASAVLAAPFLRYYFLPSSKNVNVFADASYGFGSTKASGGSSSSFNAYQIMAGPAIFLNPKTALQFAPFYRSESNGSGNSRTNTIGIEIGFQIHIGNAIK